MTSELLRTSTEVEVTGANEASERRYEERCSEDQGTRKDEDEVQ